MFKKMVVLSLLLCFLALSACGGAPTPPPAATAPASAPIATATIDPCLPKYARVLAERVNKHMREFDDASTLAASLKPDALPTAIAELQRIRRTAEDEPVPGCLSKLKGLQVGHMNTVINTLLGMLNQAKPADLQNGINTARKLHDDYTIELAVVLGVTLVAPPTSPPLPAVVSTETPAPTGLTVSNPGPTAVNLRAVPDLTGTMVAVFAVNAATPVLGKSADGKWVQVANPDKPAEKAWLYLQPVKLSGALDSVPVVTP